MFSESNDNAGTPDLEGLQCLASTGASQLLPGEARHRDEYLAMGMPMFTSGLALRAVLNEVLSPRFASLGLRWRGDYHWLGDSVDGIRPVINYMSMGGRGVMKYGVCLDFVKLPSGNRLVFNRTEKSAGLHLFEYPEGYYGRGDDGYWGDGRGVASHYDRSIHASLAKAADEALEAIAEWFARASTLEGVRQIAEYQYDRGESSRYGSRFPSPAYILAFLYAKQGELEKALRIAETLEERLELAETVRAYLPTLHKTKGK